MKKKLIERKRYSQKFVQKYYGIFLTRKQTLRSYLLTNYYFCIHIFYQSLGIFGQLGIFGPFSVGQPSSNDVYHYPLLQLQLEGLWELCSDFESLISTEDPLGIDSVFYRFSAQFCNQRNHSEPNLLWASKNLNLTKRFLSSCV